MGETLRAEWDLIGFLWFSTYCDTVTVECVFSLLFECVRECVRVRRWWSVQSCLTKDDNEDQKEKNVKKEKDEKVIVKYKGTSGGVQLKTKFSKNA